MMYQQDSQYTDYDAYGDVMAHPKRVLGGNTPVPGAENSGPDPNAGGNIQPVPVPDPGAQAMANVMGGTLESPAAAAAPEAGPAPAAPPSGPAPATPQTIQGAYQTALQAMLSGPSPQQMGRDVMSSPAVTGFNLGAQRAQERDRALLAERAAAGGYSGSGGFESGVLGNAQHYGEARARFAGEQAGQAEQGRRQELLQAFALAQAMGDNNAARALQAELARMNDSTQRDIAGDQLGYNYTNLQQNANSQALLALFGGL